MASKIIVKCVSCDKPEELQVNSIGGVTDEGDCYRLINKEQTTHLKTPCCSTRGRKKTPELNRLYSSLKTVSKIRLAVATAQLS
jgi:hypothetical protein